MHEPISIDIQKDSSSTIHQLDIQKYHADLLKRYSDYYWKLQKMCPWHHVWRLIVYAL